MATVTSETSQPTGEKSDGVAAKAKAAVSPRAQVIYEAAAEYSFRGRRDKFTFPVPILERGSGSIVVDVNGKEYIDFNSGQMCAALGHNHPRITAALQESCETLIHSGNTILNVKEVELAKRLGEIVPRPLKKSTFLGSGSDANESAITVAKMYTGGFEVAAPHANFAGLGYGARQVTFVDGWHSGYGPSAPGIYSLITPYCYRCPLSLSFPSCEHACLRLSMELLDAQSTGSLAAVITEPLFSAGGVIDAPKGWLEKLAKACHERGMLLIFDESQTGLAKTGTMFACEYEGVIPDIMTLSKHFGGGVGISALVSTPEIEEKVSASGKLVMGHSHTNDPMSCNAGLASLDIIIEEDMPAKARAIGGYWRQHLDRLSRKYEIIGDIRGRGLLQGIEFVKDHVTKEPFFGIGNTVGATCRDRGLFLSVRRRGSVLRFVPPFSTTPEQLDQAADILDGAIGDALDALARH